MWDAAAELVVRQVQHLQLRQSLECTLIYGSAHSIVGQVGSCQTLQLSEALLDNPFEAVCREREHVEVYQHSQLIRDGTRESVEPYSKVGES